MTVFNKYEGEKSMKFTKISGGIGKFAIWLLYGTLIALLIGVVGVLLWAELYVGTPVFNIVWFAVLPPYK